MHFRLTREYYLGQGPVFFVRLECQGFILASGPVFVARVRMTPS